MVKEERNDEKGDISMFGFAKQPLKVKRHYMVKALEQNPQLTENFVTLKVKAANLWAEDMQRGLIGGCE
ncbi:MAG: hypothetical protein GY858_08870 [Candidatus Omnitrophica bacterium]|nr:hypothetical protein [Candidatus Omnitrophota bacterium]